MKLEWAGANNDVLPAIWPSVEQYIIQAIDAHNYREYDTWFFLDQIQRQRMQLWVLYDAEGVKGVMLTQLLQFCGEHICDIPITAGGSIEDWQEFMVTVVEPWAKEFKCSRIEFRARKGIGRALANYGYHVEDVILTKHIATRELH